MKKTFALISLGLLWSCQEQVRLDYPETKQEAVIDTYFETEIVDNYRWLEDDLNEETANWVQKQNDLTFGELDKIPFRNELKRRLEQLWNYEKISAPFQEGDYTYFYKNEGLQNQYVLYRYKGIRMLWRLDFEFDKRKEKKTCPFQTESLSFVRILPSYLILSNLFCIA